MTDYEQAYRDLRSGVEALRDEWLSEPTSSAILHPQAAVRLMHLLASSAPATASEWECGPHTNAWNGHDARCRRIPVDHPATASEGATEHESDCTCRVYVVDHSDPEPHHPENLDREDDPACPIHGSVTGVTSSDGDRGLREPLVDLWRDVAKAGITDGVDYPGIVLALIAERAARTAQPEGVERVEWGVRFSNGNVFEARTEKSAADLASDDATYAAVRRTVTTYAPVVGPWEVVGDE